MKQCKCEHWQQCPICMPHRFDAEGNVLPPEPTPLQAARTEIERLTAELADYRKALEVRNKQLGVACMKHDLVHSLACGICLTETRDLAEHLAILAEQERVELGECRKDAERLDWLLCRVSGKEYRRIGIEYSAGCLRSDIDAAMEAKP